MSKITPFLWFNDNCEEAINLYASIFKDNFKLLSLNKFPEGSPMSGKAMSAEFKIFDQEFKAMDAGPQYKFTEAISFFISCENQEEIDNYWNALTANGGEESQCGWLKDKFGLSWQIVPKMLMDVLGGSDSEGSQRAMQCMLKMHKLDIQKLQDAYDGK